MTRRRRANTAGRLDERYTWLNVPTRQLTEIRRSVRERLKTRMQGSLVVHRQIVIFRVPCSKWQIAAQLLTPSASPTAMSACCDELCWSTAGQAPVNKVRDLERRHASN